MKAAYFDVIGGISGDMTLASLLAAGVSLSELSAQLATLPVKGFHLETEIIKRNSIAATKLRVVVDEQQHYHRHYGDIVGIIDRSQISGPAKQRAQAILRVLAEAEAAVHGSSIDKVHFHEVGAIDSIVDIAGTAVCLDLLSVDEVYSSPLKLGSSSMINTQHGTMPVPAPATIEVLKNYPVMLTSVPHELTTPTGAAIIRALSKGVLNRETLRVSSIGYGTGSKEFAEIPNLLRVLVGTIEQDYAVDEALSVETNIDDMNPQVYPYIIERLLAEGAHDAYLVPVVMKKGRPGIVLSALTDPARLDGVIACFYRETSTIGLRIQRVDRRKLLRRLLEVDTSFGRVRAKAVVRDGREIITAEFEECRRLAAERNMPVLEVMKTLERELATRNGNHP
jgi:uncharacterized protein (TIGR00299 family) protein